MNINHDPRNGPYDSAADIAARLPLLILCIVLGCLAFAISAYVLFGESGITYALICLARDFKFL